MASTSFLLIFVPLIKWGFGRDKECNTVNRRTKSRAFRILANPNVSGEGSSKQEVIMVDPVEAKPNKCKQFDSRRK